MAYSISQVLTEEGFEVVWMDDPGSLTDSIVTPDVELVIFGADADHILIKRLIHWKLRWTVQIPLIVVSCYCFQYEAMSFLGKGVDAVLVKPFDLEDIVQRVRLLL